MVLLQAILNELAVFLPGDIAVSIYFNSSLAVAGNSFITEFSIDYISAFNFGTNRSRVYCFYDYCFYLLSHVYQNFFQE